MIVEHFEQGSDEWLEARAGIFTASQWDAVMTPDGKVRTGKMPETYLNRIIAEAISSEREFVPDTYWIRRGKELEPEAVETLEAIEGIDFESVGIIYQDESRQIACSPDGINFDHEVGCEIKCPSAPEHVGYLRGGGVPDKYYHQVQGSMLVTGFDHWYFMSYHPEIKPLIIKVERNAEYIDKLKSALEKMVQQKAETIQQLEQL